MSGEIVYIVSDHRSGSTLLDQLLGAHQDICTVGEVHHLRAYALGDRSLYDPVHPLRCTCGERVPSCEFWHQVEDRLQRPLSTLVLKPRFFNWRRRRSRIHSFLRVMPRRLLQQNPGLVGNRAIQLIYRTNRVADDSFQLFDAILEVANARYVIDASKNIHRYRILHTALPKRIRLILLCRDYRGVVYSKMQRGMTLEASTQTWVSKIKQMDLLRFEISPDRVYRLRYEDFCTAPKLELGRLCKFLSLNYSSDMLSRPAGNMHHIGGSPSKLQDDQKEIKLDTVSKYAFTPDELASMRKIVGSAAEHWGYD